LNNRNFFSKIIEKWPVKILSLTAAILIAMFYRMNTLDTRSFSVPLKVETNDRFASTGSFLDTINVSLRGELNSINSILQEDIEAYIDLSKYKREGLQRAPVQIRKKGSALGVEPLEISVLPKEIPLMLEEKLRRNVPIIPVFTGTLAQGYELTNQSILPQNVTAEGSRSILEKLRDFQTETIDLEGRFDDFSILVKIINENPLITIYGDRMIEYKGTVRRISRESQILDFFSYLDTGE
jgi:YbbR domain-containing protein